GFQIQQANTSFLHGEFLKMAALEFHHDNELFRAADRDASWKTPNFASRSPALEVHHDNELFRAADRDAKLVVFQLAHGLRKSVDANAKAVFFKAVAQLVKVKHPAVHGAAAALREI